MTETEVTVGVPDDRVADFYQLFGTWLANPTHVLGPPTEERPPGSHLPDWGPAKDEQGRVEGVVRGLSWNAKEVLATLSDAPRTLVADDVVAVRAGVSPGSGTGALVAAIRDACLKQERRSPISMVKTTDGVEWCFQGESKLWRDALGIPSPGANAAPQPPAITPAPAGPSALAPVAGAEPEVPAAPQTEPKPKPKPKKEKRRSVFRVKEK